MDTMSLQLAQLGHAPQISSVTDTYVRIDNLTHTHSVLVTTQAVHPWSLMRCADLSLEHLLPIIELAPDCVLIGTGPAHKHIPTAQLAPLIQAGIAYELMSTPAACRTFPLLAADRRNILAALCIEST